MHLKEEKKSSNFLYTQSGKKIKEKKLRECVSIYKNIVGSKTKFYAAIVLLLDT